MTDRDKMMEVFEKHIHHYNCDDDTWYGCPKSSSGCADDSQGDECNCRRDKTIQSLFTALLDIFDGMVGEDNVQSRLIYSIGIQCYNQRGAEIRERINKAKGE